MMNHISPMKGYIYRAVQIQVYPSPIPLIKIKLDMKSKKDYIKIKLCRNPMLEKSGMYEIKLALFDNGDPD